MFSWNFALGIYVVLCVAALTVLAIWACVKLSHMFDHYLKERARHRTLHRAMGRHSCASRGCHITGTVWLLSAALSLFFIFIVSACAGKHPPSTTVITPASADSIPNPNPALPTVIRVGTRVIQVTGIVAATNQRWRYTLTVTPTTQVLVCSLDSAITPCNTEFYDLTGAIIDIRDSQPPLD